MGIIASYPLRYSILRDRIFLDAEDESAGGTFQRENPIHRETRTGPSLPSSSKACTHVRARIFLGWVGKSMPIEAR